jgi:hypothetical protein
MERHKKIHWMYKQALIEELQAKQLRVSEMLD